VTLGPGTAQIRGRQSDTQEAKEQQVMKQKAHVLPYITLICPVLMGWTGATPAGAQGARETRAQITISVPADAEVLFDGQPTTQKGPQRLFLTPPLVVGAQYYYTVVARWQAGGKSVEQTKTVAVTGGGRSNLDFTEMHQASYPPGPDRNPQTEAAILKKAESFVAAFHKGDAKAVAAHWTAAGDYTTQTGTTLKGRAAIEKAFIALFAENKGLKLRIDSDSLRVVAPDVAIEDGVTSVLPADGAPPSRARYTIVHVKRDGEWYLGSVRDAPYAAPGNREHLEALEWLVGEWAEAGAKGETARIAYQWGENQNFLIGEFTTTHKQFAIGGGMQRIGWDAGNKTIRSWTFDAGGSFGEGLWRRDGNRWIVTSAATLNDGKKMTATNIITHIDTDTMSFQSRDRTMDGKSMADDKEIKLKRVK
jgi:uncharacterized protein (TIGR02246 family)